MEKGEDAFRTVDRIRTIATSVKHFFRKKEVYVTINNQKCKVVGKIGTFHVTVDITGKDVKLGDIVKFTTGPMYVNNSIRREYV